MILSTITGNSSDVMAAILRLYLPHNKAKKHLITDLTYGRGVFWRKVDRLFYTVYGSDIERKTNVDLLCDAQQAPYRGNFFDCTVIDPPFGNGSTTTRKDSLESPYGLSTLKTVKDILAWYNNVLGESKRITADGGIVVVKCQNMVDSGKQVPVKYFIFNFAMDMGFDFIDEIDLLRSGLPQVRHPGRRQLHSRKNRSSFLVFGKNFYTKRKRLR